MRLLRCSLRRGRGSWALEHGSRCPQPRRAWQSSLGEDLLCLIWPLSLAVGDGNCGVTIWLPLHLQVHPADVMLGGAPPPLQLRPPCPPAPTGCKVVGPCRTLLWTGHGRRWLEGTGAQGRLPENCSVTRILTDPLCASVPSCSLRVAGAHQGSSESGCPIVPSLLERAGDNCRPYF